MTSSSFRASIHRLTSWERDRKHIAECTLYLPSRGISWQPDLHLVLGRGQRLLQKVKLWLSLLLYCCSRASVQSHLWKNLDLKCLWLLNGHHPGSNGPLSSSFSQVRDATCLWLCFDWLSKGIRVCAPCRTVAPDDVRVGLLGACLEHAGQPSALW